MCVWNGRGGACVPARTSAQRRFHTKNTRIVCAGIERRMRPCRATRAGSGVSIPKYIYASRIMHEDLTMDAPLQGDTGGHTGTAPTYLHHTFPCNPPIINDPFGHVPAIPFIVWNGRGGACVPARTSAQRRFHTKIYLRITYHARGFNDGCALAGRHGRAHRRRPYQSPSYLFAPFH